MFKKVLAIVIVGATTATSLAADASDWGNRAPRYAPPPAERYMNDRGPQRHDTPRYAVPYRYGPPAYRWPPSYRWVGAPHRYWYPAYAYRSYADRPGCREGWNDHGANRGWDRDDHRDHDDDDDDHDDNDWRGH